MLTRRTFPVSARAFPSSRRTVFVHTNLISATIRIFCARGTLTLTTAVRGQNIYSTGMPIGLTHARGRTHFTRLTTHTAWVAVGGLHIDRTCLTVGLTYARASSGHCTRLSTHTGFGLAVGGLHIDCTRLFVSLAHTRASRSHSTRLTTHTAPSPSANHRSLTGVSTPVRAAF